MTNKQISGFFIHVTPDEESLVLEFLEASGYEKNAKGIHDYLFDCIEDETEPEQNGSGHKNEVYEKVKQFVEQNPETVQFYGNMARNLISGIINKKGRK